MATATITLVSEIKKGEYKPTELDSSKKSADILLQSIDGNIYTLWLNRPIEVKGRGLKKRSGNLIEVTENTYCKLIEKYNVICDF